MLTCRNGQSFIADHSGTKHFANRLIWQGYTDHWMNQKIKARLPDERDYAENELIIIIWPDEALPAGTVELYFNESLIKYRASRMGHIAVNISVQVFNFILT